MPHLPQNPRDFRRSFSRALAGHAAVSADEIDDEHLALLFAGRVDELPAHARAALLEQVACHPWAAQLLAEAKPPIRRSDRSQRAARPRLAGGGRPSILVIGTVVTWALAACLTLAVGVWRFADRNGPTPGTASRGPTIGTYSTGTTDATDPPSGPGQYWDQRDRLAHRPVAVVPSPPPPARHGLDLRDVALLVLAVTWLLLTIPIVVWVVQWLVRRG
ncbi:hypothetical protein [Sphingomonas sp.]|uniref:hypothetical protein n=1 Tax=Sphingomonas sp. TaxID=28214 RepID=UPI003B005A86